MKVQMQSHSYRINSPSIYNVQIGICIYFTYFRKKKGGEKIRRKKDIAGLSLHLHEGFSIVYDKDMQESLSPLHQNSWGCSAAPVVTDEEQD